MLKPQHRLGPTHPKKKLPSETHFNNNKNLNLHKDCIREQVFFITTVQHT